MTNYFDESGEILLKLYKKTEEGTQYWETWNTDKENAVIHWGELGLTGDDASIEADSHQELKNKINSLIEEKKKEGFKEVPIDEQFTVLISFKLKTWGTTADLDKREEIRSIVTEHLGWTGNGICDDGEIGSGEMTLFADVIDPYVAIKSITKEFQEKKIAEKPTFTILQGEKVIEQDITKE